MISSLGLDRIRATELTLKISRIFALGFMALPFLLGGYPALFAIGVFILVSAPAQARSAGYSHPISSTEMRMAADKFIGEPSVSKGFLNLAGALELLEDYIASSGKINGPPVNKQMLLGDIDYSSVVAFRDGLGRVEWNLDAQRIKDILLPTKFSSQFVIEQVWIHESQQDEEAGIALQAASLRLNDPLKIFTSQFLRQTSNLIKIVEERFDPLKNFLHGKLPGDDYVFMREKAKDYVKFVRSLSPLEDFYPVFYKLIEDVFLNGVMVLIGSHTPENVYASLDVIKLNAEVITFLARHNYLGSLNECWVNSARLALPVSVAMKALGINEPLNGRNILGEDIKEWAKSHGLFLRQHPRLYPIPGEDDQYAYDIRVHTIKGYARRTLRDVEEFIIAEAKRIGQAEGAVRWVNNLKRAALQKGKPQLEFLLSRNGPFYWAARIHAFEKFRLEHLKRLFGKTDISGISLQGLPIWPVDGEGYIRAGLIDWMSKDNSIPPAQYYEVKKLSIEQLTKFKATDLIPGFSGLAFAPLVLSFFSGLNPEFSWEGIFFTTIFTFFLLSSGKFYRFLRPQSLNEYEKRDFPTHLAESMLSRVEGRGKSLSFRQSVLNKSSEKKEASFNVYRPVAVDDKGNYVFDYAPLNDEYVWDSTLPRIRDSSDLQAASFLRKKGAVNPEIIEVLKELKDYLIIDNTPDYLKEEIARQKQEGVKFLVARLNNALATSYRGKETYLSNILFNPKHPAPLGLIYMYIRHEAKKHSNLKSEAEAVRREVDAYNSLSPEEKSKIKNWGDWYARDLERRGLDRAKNIINFGFFELARKIQDSPASLFLEDHFVIANYGEIHLKKRFDSEKRLHSIFAIVIFSACFIPVLLGYSHVAMAIAGFFSCALIYFIFCRYLGAINLKYFALDSSLADDYKKVVSGTPSEGQVYIKNLLRVINAYKYHPSWRHAQARVKIVMLHFLSQIVQLQNFGEKTELKLAPKGVLVRSPVRSNMASLMLIEHILASTEEAFSEPAWVSLVKVVAENKEQWLGSVLSVMSSAVRISYCADNLVKLLYKADNRQLDRYKIKDIAAFCNSLYELIILLAQEHKDFKCQAILCLCDLIQHGKGNETIFAVNLLRELKFHIVEASNFAMVSSDVVSGIIKDIIEKSGHANITFGAGSTITKPYQYGPRSIPSFAEHLALRKQDFNWDDKVRAWQLSEYAGLGPGHHFSQAYALRESLFSRIFNSIENNVSFIGDSPDPRGYVERQNKAGGIDLIISGVGADGHFGFNFPGTTADPSSAGRLVKVRLTPEVMSSSHESYPDIEKNPFAWTLGLADIIKPTAAKKPQVIVLVLGKKKAQMLRESLEEADSPLAKIIRELDTTIIVADEAVHNLIPDYLQRCSTAMRSIYGKEKDKYYNIDLAVHMIDSKGNIVWVNKAWEKLFGFSEEQVIGQPVWFFVNEENQILSEARVKDKLSKRLENLPDIPFVPFRRAAESTVKVDIREWQVVDAAGEVIGIISTLKLAGDGDGSLSSNTLAGKRLGEGHNQSGKILVSLLSLGGLVALITLFIIPNWSAIAALITQLEFSLSGFFAHPATAGPLGIILAFPLLFGIVSVVSERTVPGMLRKVRNIHHELLRIAYARVAGEDVRRKLSGIKIRLMHAGLIRTPEIIKFIEAGNEFAACSILSKLSSQLTEEAKAVLKKERAEAVARQAITEESNGRITILFRGKYETHTLYRWLRKLAAILNSLAIEERDLRKFRIRLRKTLEIGSKEKIESEIPDYVKYVKGAHLEDKQEVFRKLQTALGFLSFNRLNLALETLNAILPLIDLRLADIEGEDASLDNWRQQLRLKASMRLSRVQKRIGFVNNLAQGKVFDPSSLATMQDKLTRLLSWPFLSEPDFTGMRNEINRSLEFLPGLAIPKKVKKNSQGLLDKLAILRNMIEAAIEVNEFMIKHGSFINHSVDRQNAFNRAYQEWAASSNLVRGAPRYWKARLYQAVFISEKNSTLCFKALETILIAISLPEFRKLFHNLKSHNRRNILRVLLSYVYRKPPIINSRYIPLSERNDFLFKIIAAARIDYHLDGKAKNEDIAKLYHAFDLKPIALGNEGGLAILPPKALCNLWTLQMRFDNEGNFINFVTPERFIQDLCCIIENDLDIKVELNENGEYIFNPRSEKKIKLSDALTASIWNHEFGHFETEGDDIVINSDEAIANSRRGEEDFYLNTAAIIWYWFYFNREGREWRVQNIQGASIDLFIEELFIQSPALSFLSQNKKAIAEISRFATFINIKFHSFAIEVKSAGDLLTSPGYLKLKESFRSSQERSFGRAIFTDEVLAIENNFIPGVVSNEGLFCSKYTKAIADNLNRRNLFRTGDSIITFFQDSGVLDVPLSLEITGDYEGVLNVRGLGVFEIYPKERSFKEGVPLWNIVVVAKGKKLPLNQFIARHRIINPRLPWFYEISGRIVERESRKGAIRTTHLTGGHRILTLKEDRSVSTLGVYYPDLSHSQRVILSYHYHPGYDLTPSFGDLREFLKEKRCGARAEIIFALDRNLPGDNKARFYMLQEGVDISKAFLEISLVEGVILSKGKEDSEEERVRFTQEHFLTGDFILTRDGNIHCGYGSRALQPLGDKSLQEGHNKSGHSLVGALILGALAAFMVSVALIHWTTICAFIADVITVYPTSSLLGVIFLGYFKFGGRKGKVDAAFRGWFNGLRYWFSLFIIGISVFVNNGCISVDARRMEFYRSLKEVIAISNINEEGKEKGLEKYFLENCYLGDDIMLEPTEHLKMAGITQEDLYKCYQKLVRSRNFNVAFYAARCLAMLEDPAGSLVLGQGLKGGYNINDFFPRGTVSSGDDQNEIRNYVRMQAAFALARLEDPTAIGHLQYLLSKESNSISAVRVYAAYSLSIFDDLEALEILIKYSADPDRSVRLECLRGLLMFSDPRLFDIFVDALKDKKIDAVDIAISGLSVSGNKRAAVYLENIIQESKSANTRSKALAALYRFEGDRVLNLALAKVRDNAEEVRMTALSILSQLNGLDAREALISGLNDRSHLVRMTAALGFWGGKFDKTQAPDLIARLLKRERNSDVRLLYIGILGESNDNAAREALRNIIRGGNLREAQAAILSSAFNADDKMVHQLADLVSDSREEIRQVSVAALHTRIDDPVIFNKVFERMGDVSLRVASSAAVVLSTQINNHPELKSKLIGFMDRGDLETRLGILSGLSQAGSPIAVEFAKPYLNSQDLALKQMAVFSISQLVDHNTLPLLSPLASDIDPSVRLSAIRGLAMINSSETVPLLVKALKDEQFPVRQAAISGLAQRIHDSPHLTFTIRPFLRDDHWQVRQAAVEALGKSTHSNVPEILLPTIQDESVFVRQAAVANLARFDTPEVIKSMLPLLKDRDVFVRRDTIVALGSKVCAHLELAEPIKEAAKVDSDEIARRYANYALECGKNEGINHGPVKIRSMQILIPGFDDFYLFVTARNQEIDWSNKHPLKDMLERIGVTSRAFNWSGNIQDTFSARSRVLDFFLENVRDAARMRVDIDMDWHSWGTPIGTTIFSGSPKATEAFRLAREAGIKINISCLGSPDMLHRVSFLENKYKETVKIINLWSPADRLSFPSVPVNLGVKGNIGIPETSHNDWFDYSMGNRFIRMKFPDLDMPQIHRMIKQSNPIGWIYRPRVGSWPGMYNFNSVAPLGHFRQAGNINISPALSEMQRFRAPDNYYLHQGLLSSQAFRASMLPGAIFQNNFRPLPSGQLNFNVYNNNRIIMPPTIKFRAPSITVPKFAPITVPRSNFVNPGITPRIPTYIPPIRYTPPPMRNLN